MPTYRLRGAKRDVNGMIGEPLFERRFMAGDEHAAIVAIDYQGLDEAPPDVNVFWLTNETGRLVWSLRRADQEPS